MKRGRAAHIELYLFCKISSLSVSGDLPFDYESLKFSYSAASASAVNITHNTFPVCDSI